MTRHLRTKRRRGFDREERKDDVYKAYFVLGSECVSLSVSLSALSLPFFFFFLAFSLSLFSQKDLVR